MIGDTVALREWHHQTKGNNSARQTRDTIAETLIAYGISTWHASKYKVYINSIKGNSSKRMPPLVYIPSISSTLGDAGVFRYKHVHKEWTAVMREVRPSH